MYTIGIRVSRWYICEPKISIHFGGVNTLYCLEEWRGEQRISPLGDTIHPWGTTSPLGSKFAPRGKVKNGPLLSLEFVSEQKYVHNKSWLLVCE
jgi:hypothetical protein